MNKLRNTHRLFVFVLLTLGLSGVLLAAGAPIGMAVAKGSFQVDHSRVWENTTLFDGSVVETAAATSDLRLTSGVQVRLAPDSRATIYRQKLLLEQGYTQIQAGADYQVEARSLRVSLVGKDTVARVKTLHGSGVTVAAVAGAVRVMNQAGMLIADITAGGSLDLEPQAAGASAPTRASGCLLEKAGNLILAEQTTNIILQVTGADLAAEVGNRVEIQGMAGNVQATVPGVSQVIQVAAVKRIAKGGCVSMAKKLGASTAAAAAGATAAAAGTAGAAGVAGATAAGIGAGTVAVVGGVAAAATVGGLAAAGSLPGQGETQSSVSR